MIRNRESYQQIYMMARDQAAEGQICLFGSFIFKGLTIHYLYIRSFSGGNESINEMISAII